MTVNALLAALGSAGVRLAVAGVNLEVEAGEVPPHLDGWMDLLNTGVRAKLTGRSWWGIGRDGLATGAGLDGRLSFAEEVPPATTRLAVGGDPPGTWDRVRWPEAMPIRRAALTHR